MTTTFRKEFDKADVFDDIDAKFIPTYTDIDMDKVKQAVYMETTAKAKVITRCTNNNNIRLPCLMSKNWKTFLIL